MPAGRPPKYKSGFHKPTQDMVKPIIEEGVGTFTHTAHLSRGASDAVRQYLIKIGVIDGKTN